jgi:hypothetical protein
MPNIDIAALRRARQQPAPAPQPAPPSPERREWIKWLALAAAAVALAWVLSGRGITPGPGPTPIDAEGLHVLIVVDPSKSLTAGQAAVVNSAIIPDWAEANAAKYRRYDAKDDLSTEDRVWREMRATVTDPPAMVTLKNGRASVGPVPDGIDRAKAQLERLR